MSLDAMNTPQEFCQLIAEIQRRQTNGFEGGLALVTLVATHGSSYRRVGARMLVAGDGTVMRGLSGGCPQADIVARALSLIHI